MKYTHQNFYRKHRPTKFSQVAGQEFITNVLRQQIQHQKNHHAYLFAGMQGIGKTTTARILARAVNCLNNQLGEACGDCKICQQSQINFVDIIEIDAASNNGVEQIRNLREKVFISPSFAKYKVYIIDEVHMLSKGAYNAFLKILEEPPRHVIFILATTELFKIPETIMSRCQIFIFRPLIESIMIKVLGAVAEKEGVVCDESALQTISQHARGSVRDALNFLEQMAFLQKGSSLTASDIEQQLGKTNANLRFKFLNHLMQKNKKAVLETIDEFAKTGVNFDRLRRDLIEQINQNMLQIYRNFDVPIDNSHLQKTQIPQFKIILTVLLDNKYQITNTFLSPITFFQLLTLEIFDHLYPEVFDVASPNSASHFEKKVSEAQKQSTSSFQNSSYQEGLKILQNKLTSEIKAIKEGWNQISVYSSQQLFKPYVEVLLKIRPVAASENHLLVCSKNNESLRDQINNWQDENNFQKFIKLVFARQFRMYAVTDDELTVIRLEYEKQHQN